MTPHSLSPAQRARLAEVAAALVPPGATMPGAADIALAREGGPIERVLRVRPDLAVPLAAALDAACGLSVEQLAAERPDAVRVLLQVVIGAYYLDPEVKRRLGYDGQQALTLPRGGFGGEDLLALMMESPPRYRDPETELARRPLRPTRAEALP